MDSNLSHRGGGGWGLNAPHRHQASAPDSVPVEVQERRIFHS